MPDQPQHTGVQGINIIKKYEGLRLDKYQDATGKWTIGYGHLILPNELFAKRLTQEEANSLLMCDLKKTEEGIRRYVTSHLNQNQFDALVSFTFNLGVNNLKGSTLLRLINQGLFVEAAVQFLRWNKAGGQVLKGLTLRRQAEQDLFSRTTNSDPISY